MKMKSIITVFLSLFLFSCGTKTIDPGAGGSCQPKWWMKAESDSNVVYGYGREGSRDSGTAIALSMAEAQRNALSQINSEIQGEVGKAVEELERESGGEVSEDYSKGVYNELRVDSNAPCNYCSRADSEECVDGNKLIVYTKVRVNVEDYLNEELREKMNSLLSKPEALLDNVRKK
tara:strand:+ start:27 stop:554 length:528 start_codon:yes stop_codon:yes gene_type:complete